jgi:lysophospholipase L1-like esterase
MNRKVFVLAAVVLAFGGSLLGADFTPLKDGDRVVFYGNSITQQRLYTTYLEEYVHCRYPDLNVTFFNAGWSGDTAAGALTRLERDVLPLKPTVVTVFFGMNDGGYQPPDEGIRALYRDSMEKLVTSLQAAKARVIVFGPGCVDEDRQERLKSANYNKTLQGLNEEAKAVAAKHRCVFVDVYGPMLKFQSEQKAKNRDFAMSVDGVHPNEAGHLVMCRAMVTALAEPGIAVTTDKPAPPATADEPYAITTRAIPFWVPTNAKIVARDCGLLDYAAAKLTIPELPAGNYLLSVDDMMVGNLTALQLATGIPLPASSRAQHLHDLITTKGENYFAAWRNVRLPLADLKTTASVYDAMMKTDDALNSAIDDLVRNTKSTISLSAEPLGPDLALNKPYVCSDPNTYGWNPGLTDGSWETVPGHCFATGPGAEFPKSVTIDLGSSSPIGAVVVGVPPFGSTKTVDISVSGDGKTFAKIGSHGFAQRQLQHYIYSAPAGTSGRYVRLTYVDHYADAADYLPTFAFTIEAEVYAQGAPGR